MTIHFATHSSTHRLRARILKGILLILLVIILIFSKESFKGAQDGLLLWWNVLVPTLLPFMILSNLLVSLNVTNFLSRLLYPVFRRFLPVSKDGCYPIFIGFFAGYPVGAKTTSDLKKQHLLSPKEAQMLCSMTNNASPAFILSYLCMNRLHIASIGSIILLIIYLSSIIGGLLWYHTLGQKRSLSLNTTFDSKTDANKKGVKFSIELLDHSIMNAFEILTKVGGYIILFSILASLIQSIPGISPLTKALLAGTLEITTGINCLCALSIPKEIIILLAVILTSFGGLCAMAQTSSVMDGSGLKISDYFICKLFSGFISAIFILIFFYFYKL